MGGTPKTALPSQDRAASLPRLMPILQVGPKQRGIARGLGGVWNFEQ
ncbi:MAG: hypothetical protein F6K46_35925 [Moorea sp. SIO3E8]|nr:hypothetical protein [Moorena sp. SIO3E8]